MRDEIWREFVGEVCGGCHKPKVRGQSFCKDCYFNLPKELRKKLWQRFGNGYEEAHEEAIARFRENVPIEAKA
jgi:hypothetical protein